MAEEYILRGEYNHDKEKIYSNISSTNQRITVLETMFEAFKTLPASLASLDKTMALMQSNLENLNRQVDKIDKDNQSRNDAQDKSIKEIDSKSKIDFLQYVKDNWWKLLPAVLAGLAVYGSVVK